MTIDSRSVDELRRAETLENLLQRAISVAAGYGEQFYDLPNQAAVERARELLHQVAHAFADTEPFDVAVGVDGGIEVTAALGPLMVTVDVSPTGSRIDAIIDDGVEVKWIGHDLTAREVLKEIERAA